MSKWMPLAKIDQGNLFIPSQEDILPLYNGVYVCTYNIHTLVNGDRKPALSHSLRKKKDSCGL